MHVRPAVTLPLSAALLASGLLVLAAPAQATCQVATVPETGDINYTTVCVLEHGDFGDPSNTHDYLLHASHAVEVDPAFEYAYVRSDQGEWHYDDGEFQAHREWSHFGAGSFWGVRGLVGSGAHANLEQRDQTIPEEGETSCSYTVGQSTCFGAGGWFTVQDVASVGVGVYQVQLGSGESCEQATAVYVDAVVAFVPWSSGPGACTVPYPDLYESARIRDLPPGP